MTDATWTDLFAHRAFVRLWLSRIAAVTAGQMLMVAMGWQLYDLTSSAWDLGLVGLCQFVPALLMTLPGGHVADRMHRGRLIAISLAAPWIAALTLGVFTEAAGRSTIFALSVLLGVARAFQMPAQQALLPMLVPAAKLPRVMAVSSGGLQAAIIGGPALGGVLYAFGPRTVYLSCVLLISLAIVLTLTVRYAHRPTHQASTWSGVFDGVRYVWAKKVLLGANSLDLFAVLLGGATALLPMFARDILHTGPSGLGLLRAAPAMGALAMAVTLTRWPLQRRVGAWLLRAVAVFGLATIAFGLSQSFVLSLLALAVSGAADNVSVVVRQTLAQFETPDHMRGRVAAVNSLFIGASNQLGEFESGATAALWGAVASVVVGGVGTVTVAALWTKLFPALALRDTMAGEAAAADERNVP